MLLILQNNFIIGIRATLIVIEVIIFVFFVFSGFCLFPLLISKP